MTEPWTFGVPSLPQTQEVAGLLREVAGLAMAMEGNTDAVAALIGQLRAAQQSLSAVAPADLAPRVGADAPAERRVYLDHSRDIGAYNPCFPEYTIEVSGGRAQGTVTLPARLRGTSRHRARRRARDLLRLCDPASQLRRGRGR